MLTTIKGMHSPAHPGEILRELYMKPLGLGVGETAAAVKVSRKHLSAIINGRASVTAGMALRLAAAFHTDAEIWLNLQGQYDLWEARSGKVVPKINALVPRAAV